MSSSRDISAPSRLQGLATYAGTQSSVSLREAQEETRARGVDYRVSHVTHKFTRRLWRHWRAPIEDAALFSTIARESPDFLIINPGAALMRRPRLLKRLLHEAERRQIESFVYWHSCAWLFANKRENQVGEDEFEALAAELRRPWLHHLTLAPQAAQDLAEAIGVKRSFLVGNCRRLPARYEGEQVPETPPVVVNVASVQPRKGPDLFVDVAEQVCREHPAVRFVWVGGYANDELARDIQSRGLAGRVAFIGPVHPPFEWLRRASVVFFPSRSEAFGLVAVEAMASRRTVCCFEGTGTEYVVGDTGLVVPRFDTSVAAGRILECLSLSPEERVNHAARSRYESMFAPRPYALRLATVISQPDSNGAEYLFDA